MQLPEKYKENCDVSSESPSSGVTSGGQENDMGLNTKEKNRSLDKKLTDQMDMVKTMYKQEM
jgi:hypothetical protein